MSHPSHWVWIHHLELPEKMVVENKKNIKLLQQMNNNKMTAQKQSGWNTNTLNINKNN